MTMSSRGLLIAILAFPAVASAQFSLGLRAGYAIPAGDAYEQSGFGVFKQKDLAKSAIPIQIDASWRFTPALSAGLYFGYAFGQTGTKLKEMCSTAGASCDSPSFMRYGVQAAWSFMPGEMIDPWVGVAAGIESASFAVKNFMYGFIPPSTPLVADLDGTLRGWEARAEVGADYRRGAWAAGPYFSFGVGQYRVQHVTLSGQGTVAGGSVDSAQTHEWFTLGLRGRFDL